MNYPEVGYKLGKFELNQVLGEGTTAKVFKSYNKYFKKDVVIKVLSNELLEKSPKIRDIFFEEAYILSKIKHQNIIEILDADEKEYCYTVMEFVDGKTIEDIIESGKIFEPKEGIGILIQICQALEHINSLNIVHRDIKPGNIIITAKNTSKILDFGISKVIHEPVKYSLIGGPMCGTLYYMSPEQLTDSERVNCKSDMYSLGATMYHMFTGKIPFETNNISELMTMHISKIPENPKTLNNNIIEDLSLLIMRLLEKSPSKRFENYEEIIFSLLNILKKYEKIESFSKENIIIVEELEKANKTISKENKEESDGLQKMFFDKLSKGTVFEKEEPVKKEKTKLKKEFTDSVSLTSKFLKNYVNIADSEEGKTQEEEKVILDIDEIDSKIKEKNQKNISNEKINFDDNLPKKIDEKNNSKDKFRKEMTDSVNLTSKFLKNFVTPVDFKDENIKVADKENIINKSDEKIDKEINEKKLINENAKIPEHFKDKIKLTDKDRNNNINEKNSDLSKFDSDLAEKDFKNISNSY